MTKVNLVFFNAPYNDLITDKLTNKLLSSDDYNFILSMDARELIPRISNFKRGIFLLYVSTKNDLKESLKIINVSKKLNLSMYFRFYCVLPLELSKSKKLLAKAGCLGFYSPKEDPQVISKKLEILRIKSLQFEKIKYLTPLRSSSDSWIIESKSDMFFKNDTWNIHSMGPSPSVGDWIETKNNEEYDTWEFIFKNADDEDCFVEIGKSWFFKGELPDFDWAEKYWKFKSNDPHLYLQDTDNKKTSKFLLKDDKLCVTENSVMAIAKKELILGCADTNFDALKFEELKKNYRNNFANTNFNVDMGEVSVDLELMPKILNLNFNLDCDFEEIDEKELTIVAPHNSLSSNDKVKASVLLKFDGKKQSLVCQGEIIEIEDLGEKDSLIINIEKMDKSDFKQFFELYFLRETSLSELMERAQGF